MNARLPRGRKSATWDLTGWSDKQGSGLEEKSASEAGSGFFLTALTFSCRQLSASSQNGHLTDETVGFRRRKKTMIEEHDPGRID